MAKIGLGKYPGWLVVTLLSQLLTVNAQPGIVYCFYVLSDKICFETPFLSIDCGAKRNHTAENNIKWVSDTNYIEVGKTADIGNASRNGSYLHSLRYFPKPLNKSCYHLPVTPSVPVLVRLWFAIGNYSGFAHLPISFAFSIETLDMLGVHNITFTGKTVTDITDIYKDAFRREEVLVSSGRVLYVCLIRTSEDDDPYISGIELRTLRDGMYQQAKPGTRLYLHSRYDLGGESWVRYPQDEFDRLWLTDIGVNPADAASVQRVSVQKVISRNDTQNLPPSAVMQTAWISRDILTLNFSQTLPPGDRKLLLLYFADIEPFNMTFFVSINGQTVSNITMLPNDSTLERAFLTTDTGSDLVLQLFSAPRLILNAFEFYSLFDTEQATYSKDIEALQAIKRRFDITDWISDPCYVIEWKGIGCNNRSAVVRITEINLSGRNLSGSVPDNIGELTALVYLSLENNHLTGPLPNFSNLSMLEGLHLQNSNLTGSVPDWLSVLENLKELFIDNNNFSGVFPAQLISKQPSLKIRTSGNPYLKFIPSNSSKHKRTQSFWEPLGSITGFLIIVLLLIVGIVVHRKQSRGKESRRLYEGDSMVIVPNTTKFRAFTLAEILAATQNFSQKIGQGGCGSVFFGKLKQQDIAVKVLSLLSRQGVQEFLNEINLLSTVHHKNLVSLLGYCNESRELMLIYEHMSGGSLRDRLYGPGYELNWKTRVKIALDAAQGLEYLHVGCTPKIIHRDVKTANILLDNNMKGKIADFGLSRLTTGGDASHVTTLVKGTPGYLDPAYFRTQMLTEKSDVYSFGVVLLELICGRPPINANVPEDELDLVQWVTQYAEKDENLNEIEVIIDKSLGGNYDLKSVVHVAKLALRCVQSRPSLRPSANEVVAELRGGVLPESDLPISEWTSYSEAGPSCSRVDDMKWDENSSNLPQVGR